MNCLQNNSCQQKTLLSFQIEVNPIDISDEQFNLLIEADKPPRKKIYNKNNSASIAGIVIIIIGILAAFSLSEIPLIGLTVAVGVAASSILFGILHISLGSIIAAINKLHDYLEDRFR
jgi:hypothetical protein